MGGRNEQKKKAKQLSNELSELLYEDEMITVVAYPSLNRICIQCKSKGDYDMYLKMLKLLPKIRGMLLASLETLSTEPE